MAESLDEAGVESRGDAADPAGGTSVLEESETYVRAVALALAELAERGFPTQFEITDDSVHCLACSSRCRSADVGWLTRAEVAAAADGRASLVCGLRCPVCGARGSATATIEQWEQRRTPGARSHTER
jgi:hypothetical protein